MPPQFRRTPGTSRPVNPNKHILQPMMLLHVPFEIDRGRLREFGCQWDTKLRRWWVPSVHFEEAQQYVDSIRAAAAVLTALEALDGPVDGDLFYNETDLYDDDGSPF